MAQGKPTCWRRVAARARSGAAPRGAVGDGAAGGQGGFGVAATIDGDVEIATGALASAPERRVVRVQGAAASANALADWLSVLWLTPAMDRLFVEPASERRRFLDRLVLALAPAHGMHATRYDAAMRERNRLLASEARSIPTG